MAWIDRTAEEKQVVYDRLNEQAQPMRDAIARETMDRDAAPPEAAGPYNDAIAMHTASLGPYNDALAFLAET